MVLEGTTVCLDNILRTLVECATVHVLSKYLYVSEVPIRWAASVREVERSAECRWHPSGGI